jgi:hypothetical protein
MPFARRGRPGLLGTVARTAVVTGTASATANAVNRRAHQQAPDQQQAAADRAAPPAAAGAPDGQPDLVDRITELARLHDAGVLTDAEFGAAKARLLAG